MQISKWLPLILFGLHSSCLPVKTNLVKINEYKNDHDRELEIQRIAEDNFIHDDLKFLRILELSLSMRESYSGGVHVLFSRHTNWERYMLIYTNGSLVWGDVISTYKGKNLSFLSRWDQQHCNDRLFRFMKDLGCYKANGEANCSLLSKENQEKILSFAKAEYASLK